MRDARIQIDGEPPSPRRQEARAAGPHAAKLGVGYRACAETDLPFLQGVYASTRLEELAPLGWADEMRDAFLRQQFEAQHAHYRAHYPDAEWLVVLLDGGAVGRLYLETWPSQMRIIDIALLPPARGRGFGTAILRDLMGEAAAKALKVSIHVEKANRAMRLYRNLGFRIVEDKGVYDLLEWHQAWGERAVSDGALPQTTRHSTG